MRTKNAQFNALLPVIIQGVIGTYSTFRNVAESEATKILYNSKTYNILEDQKSGFWKLSNATLSDILASEVDGLPKFSEVFR